MKKRAMSYLFRFFFWWVLNITVFTGLAVSQEGGPEEFPREIMLPPSPPHEVITPQKKAVSPSSEKLEMSEEKGKIKSLELRGVDVLEVIMIIAKQSSFNIVTSKELRGGQQVTVYLKDIDVWDAFQLIIKANQLAYTREGDNLLVMTEREYQQLYGRPFNDLSNIEVVRLQYAKAMEVQRVLVQMKAGAAPGAAPGGRGVAIDERANAIILIDTSENIKEAKRLINELDVPTSTYVFTLRYLDSRQLESKIKPILTKQGTVDIDLATNKVVVTDIPENIIKVKALLKEFDQEPTTVTKVFSLEYGKFEDMEKVIIRELTPGVGRIQSDKRTNKMIVVDLPGNMARIEKIVSELDERTRQVLIEAKVIQVVLNDKNQMGINWEKAFYNLEKFHNLNIKGKFEMATKGALSPGVELTIGELGDTKDDYTAFIQMLQTLGQTKTLSNPRITAINNEEAKIHVGTKEAYVTQTVSQAQTTSTTAESVTFVDVGVTLKVTPTINRQGMITMKIRPEVSSVSSTINTAQGNVIPILSTSETETNIMVKDGVTIIIGGLIKDEKIKSTSQIPILGYIPIAGLLFQKKTDEIKKTELVILLTPHSISGETGLGDLYKPFLDKKIFEEKP